MYIIDKNKDYYDYLSHIYGVDKKVVFDRRGSINLTNTMLFNIANYGGFYNETRARDLYLVLEVGDTQYLLKLYHIKGVTDYYTEVSFDIELARVYREHKKLFNDTVMALAQVDNYIPIFTRKYGVPASTDELGRRVSYHTIVSLPILKDTIVTKVIDKFELWKTLSTYISSLNNDKDVTLAMSDEEKASIHGFDKNSFRNPIKMD
jgi:hypothetical protein